MRVVVRKIRVLEGFGKFKGIGDHVLCFFNRGWLKTASPESFPNIGLSCSFWLENMKGSSAVRLPTPFTPHKKGQGHPLQHSAHVFHHAHAALLNGRGRSHFKSDFFIGAVFEIQTRFLGKSEKIQGNLRGRRAGVSGGNSNAGFNCSRAMASFPTLPFLKPG